ncbi:MAG: tRNA-dihydrouridine synthase family protein [Muribaculaceae bacterium]|nr:tRNA-dihydrouridine synthase family protein [Muribaculaceae bacterium]
MQPFIISAAPLQGYTTHIWRRAHHAVMGGVDDYTTPFIRVERGAVRRHDLADVAPAMNDGVPVVPQILACEPAEALLMMNELIRMGHRHIDLNLGCPFPPIALHGKGSGMLAQPERVAKLMAALASVDGVRYSVKMRLGWDDDSQWRAIVPLLDALNPVRVVVHPRIGRQQYGGEVNMPQFEQLLKVAGWPVFYNGEITRREQIDGLRQRYPLLSGVMVGRALVAHPALLSPERASADHYRTFHDLLVTGYRSLLTGGDHQVLSHLKALWQLFLPDAPARARKAIKKSTSLTAYLAAADAAISAL